MIAAGARREEPRRQPEIALAVIAVVATDLVARVGPTGHRISAPNDGVVA